MNPRMVGDIYAGRHVKAAPLANALNLSLQVFYDAVARGEVKAVRIGKAIRIPAREAARLLDLPPASAQQAA